MFELYARYLCSRDALGLKAARPSARATIGYIVYKCLNNSIKGEVVDFCLG